MDLKKAAEICKAIAAEAARWGKHAGFASYHADEVREALITIDEAGLFDLEGEKEARISANKNAGAAKARAVRSQKALELARKQIESLTTMGDERIKLIDTLTVRCKKLEAKLEKAVISSKN
jgi:hypothetical protein